MHTKLPSLSDLDGLASGPHRVLVVDDHPVFRHGMRKLLSQILELEFYAEAENAATALEAAQKIDPTLALIDVSMPGVNGIELTRLILAQNPAVQVLILSMHDETRYAIEAFRAGARGYLTKQDAMEEIADAVQTIVTGQIYVGSRFSRNLIFQAIESSESRATQLIRKLSQRELEVFRLFGSRYSTRKVAENLGLSVKTIETHRSHIKEKLNMRSGAELIKFAIDWTVASAGADPAQAAG